MIVGKTTVDGKSRPTEAATSDTPVDLRGARILVIMPSVPVQGMERSNLQIMKMMRQRGAEVLFVVERLSPDVAREAERMGCDVAPATFYQGWERRLHLSRNPFEMAGVVWAWARSALDVDRVYRQYKPTHIHVTNLDYFLYALPTLRRARCPVVFRLPNPPDFNLSVGKQKLSNWIWRRLVLPRCDAVVCNCRYTLSQVLPLGLRREKAFVIHNCLAARAAVEPSDAPRLDAGKVHIAYAGRIRPDKGVDVLCDAAARIVAERPDVQFHLAGEYEWKNPFATELIERVRTKGLDGHIRFYGEIRDVMGLFAQVHLHVCPSVSPMESFPNVLLEAKSRGIASVVFPTAGIREAVTHGVDGYICRDTSSQALYEGIRYYLDRPQELRRAGEAARGSLRRFSEEAAAGRWAALYRSLGPTKVGQRTS